MALMADKIVAAGSGRSKFYDVVVMDFYLFPLIQVSGYLTTLVFTMHIVIQLLIWFKKSVRDYCTHVLVQYSKQ